jgi:PleD family two-component response regulator
MEQLIESLEDALTALPQAKSSFGDPLANVRPRILVVDDDTYCLDLLQEAFESDYEVLFATNGMAALEIAVKSSPDLILLDVMMPHMDGYEVCKHLKAEPRTDSIPIIFVTGLWNMSFETTALDMGAVDYIIKPISPGAVRARVNRQIQLKRSLDRLVQAAALEKTLREDLLEALELKNHWDQVH